MLKKTGKKNLLPKISDDARARETKKLPTISPPGTRSWDSGRCVPTPGFCVVVVLISPQQQLGSNSKSPSPGFQL